MTRLFTFTADSRGRVDFRLAYEAFRGRNPEKITKDERAQMAEIQRVLESISDPVGELADDADVDMRQRKLAEFGGTIEIGQRAHERLTTYVEEAPFMAGLSMQVEAFKDRWSAAEKVDSPDATATPPVRSMKAVRK